MLNVTLSRQAFTSFEVGQYFLNYYQSHGYKVIPGSSLLDPSVPMTFVMSAGLAQVETSAMLHGGRTGNYYALLQNCFRYFDMENVGNSNIHLSLFQMPGAFTFNLLSKQDHIAQVWNLLTKVYGFHPESLWATYFAGDRVSGYTLKPDWKTYHSWCDIGVNPDRIVGLDAKNNFWKQSANIVGEDHAAKCGPNTEVFFDRGVHLNCGQSCQPGCNCGRFVEILNMLFIMQHMDEKAGIVKLLDEPFIETVVGAERVAMVLQGASSVFEIDSIQPLIEHVRRFIKLMELPAADIAKYGCVIADHIRALLFLAADGAPAPGKGGRARLMRKLIRGILTSQKILGISDPAFARSLAEVALGLYVEQQPQLKSAQNSVQDYIADERKRFEYTLKAGFRYLDRILNQGDNMSISGEDILKLEKHHGIPKPLLLNTLALKQIRFNCQAYKEAYIQWRQALT